MGAEAFEHCPVLWNSGREGHMWAVALARAWYSAHDRSFVLSR